MSATVLEIAKTLAWDTDFELTDGGRVIPGLSIEVAVLEIGVRVKNTPYVPGFLVEGTTGQYLGVVEIAGDKDWDTIEGQVDMNDDEAVDALVRAVIERWLFRGAFV